MPFDSVNVREDAGATAWASAGKPIVPSIEVDGHAMPILHVSQISSLLDLPTDELPANPRLAFDTVNVLTSWLEIMEQLDWELLTKPTPSRGRSIKNLTVNTFHPFELLPEAWRGGDFPWYPEEDAAREASLGDAAALRSYARDRLMFWQMFLLDVEGELEGPDRPVTSPRGDATFSVVLTAQRWHCAFHHRQVVHFLHGEGVELPGALNVEVIHDLELPENVF